MLIRTLDRNEPHRRPLDRFADRLGVGHVVLLALDVSVEVEVPVFNAEVTENP